MFCYLPNHSTVERLSSTTAIWEVSASLADNLKTYWKSTRRYKCPWTNKSLKCVVAVVVQLLPSSHPVDSLGKIKLKEYGTGQFALNWTYCSLSSNFCNYRIHFNVVSAGTITLIHEWRSQMSVLSIKIPADSDEQSKQKFFQDSQSASKLVCDTSSVVRGHWFVPLSMPAIQHFSYTGCRRFEQGERIFAAMPNLIGLSYFPVAKMFPQNARIVRGLDQSGLWERLELLYVRQSPICSPFAEFRGDEPQFPKSDGCLGCPASEFSET